MKQNVAFASYFKKNLIKHKNLSFQSNTEYSTSDTLNCFMVRFD